MEHRTGVGYFGTIYLLSVTEIADMSFQPAETLTELLTHHPMMYGMPTRTREHRIVVSLKKDQCL